MISLKRQKRRAKSWRRLPIGVLLDHLEELERLQHFAGHVLGSDAVVGGTHAVPIAASVDLGHGAHAGTPA